MIAAASCAIVPTAHASTHLPLTSTASSYTKCGNAAAAAGPVSQSRCDVTQAASTKNGSVSSSATLVSPLNGFAPWTAYADSLALVASTFDLPAPTKQLHFTVDIHMSRASADLSFIPGSLDDAYFMSAFGGLLFNNWEQVGLVARAFSAPCGLNCNAGTGTGVLTQFASAGSTSATGKDYVLEFSMGNADGGDIPAGPVTVEAGVSSGIQQTHGPGDDTVSIEGVVRGIYLD